MDGETFDVETVVPIEILAKVGADGAGVAQRVCETESRFEPTLLLVAEPRQDERRSAEFAFLSRAAVRSDDIIVGCGGTPPPRRRVRRTPRRRWAVYFWPCAEGDVGFTLANKRYRSPATKEVPSRVAHWALSPSSSMTTMAHCLAGSAGDAAEVCALLTVLADEFTRDIVLDAFQGNGGVRATTVHEHGEYPKPRQEHLLLGS